MIQNRRKFEGKLSTLRKGKSKMKTLSPKTFGAADFFEGKFSVRLQSRRICSRTSILRPSNQLLRISGKETAFLDTHHLDRQNRPRLSTVLVMRHSRLQVAPSLHSTSSLSSDANYAVSLKPMKYVSLSNTQIKSNSLFPFKGHFVRAS